MAILNFGSINIDIVYRVAHLPRPGETVTSRDRKQGLGGKGANMSIAAAATGADIRHLGAVGADGAWTLDALSARGVDVAGVASLDTPTGHAMIVVDDAGENAITLFPGANRALPFAPIAAALAAGGPDDWLLVQNETAHVPEAVAAARRAGARVAYAAAPFDAETALALIDDLDLLAVNEIEARQLESAAGAGLDTLPVPQILITRGGDGATLLGHEGRIDQGAIPAEVVDTTGAGDTFLGVFLGEKDSGATDAAAMKLAAHVAAMQVARAGAAAAIPTPEEVSALRGKIGV